MSVSALHHEPIDSEAVLVRFDDQTGAVNITDISRLAGSACSRGSPGISDVAV